MAVSVVICAYTAERWDDLVRSARSCQSQTLMPTEVIVVIDYNDELLQRAIAEMAGVKVIPNRSSKGLSGARNTGVSCSTGDVLVFLDDDAYGEATWLEKLVAPLADQGIVGVGGWIEPEWPGRVPRWFPESFYWVLGCSYFGLASDGARIRNPIGASMAIRRGLFDSVGGFSPSLGRIGRNPLGCEETELCIRYSKVRPDEVFVMSRDSVVHHRVPNSRLTWRYFLTRCWAEGLSKAAVSALVGPQSGLSSERSHAARFLPREFVRSLREVWRSPHVAIKRMALIATGTVLAVAGVIRGTLAIRRSPIVVVEEDLSVLRNDAKTGDDMGLTARGSD